MSIRPSPGQASPSIEQLYTDVTSPGLSEQPGTVQLGEGIRIRPVMAADAVRLNYSLSYQQFFAPENTNFSFQRVTIDLGHEFALYRNTTRVLDSRPSNGPDDCAIDPVTHPQSYRDLDAVFERRALPKANGQYVSYQLIRNVLAAYALDLAFCVLLDSRRPDLLEAWYTVMKCVRIPDLRTRCKVLTWQELSEVLPPDLQKFLDLKYGIAPPGCSPSPIGIAGS